MVDGGEEPQPDVPRIVVAEDRAYRARILGESFGKARVDRRAELLEVLGLSAECLALAVFERQAASAASAAFACSATAANACGSETAMSASDLRSSSIPAFWTPEMNWL